MDYPGTRVMNHKKYHHLYSHFYHFGDECTYCGEIAVCLDHAPALVRVEEVGPDFFHELKIPFLLLPACTECNAWLSGNPLDTVQDRATFILGRLQAKYGRFLEVKRWSEEELSTFGANLHAVISEFSENQDILQLRIDHLITLIENGLQSP
jgi:hypothetical protein